MSNTSPYHPEGDGQCERLNRTIINMLKSIPDNEKRNWKDHLAKLTFAYNATINKTTQFSPFFLLFGREPRLPIDDVFPELPSLQSKANPGAKPSNNDDVINRENYGEYARTWNKKMREAFELANNNIGKSGRYMKEFYDRKRKPCINVNIGDRVLVRNVRPKGTTRAGKLAGFWNPEVYEVVEQLEGVPVYVIREWGSHSKKTRTLHRNLLKQINEFAPLPNAPVQVASPAVSSPLPNDLSATPSCSVPVSLRRKGTCVGSRLDPPVDVSRSQPSKKNCVSV